ncbi:hypothetical protein CVT24_007583 [Panaeolus cyanescens]|uniref:Uncharacterized protein n=1 Tax=Panaeolus cyanescens TaxID=181874 RepID=A0A409VR30_9AGAR|nr:hypothetical protein CVT24_007583 [Panaeolus cyanescens]
MVISHNEDVQLFPEYSPTLPSSDTSFYGRDSLLGYYISHGSLTTLTLNSMEEIPMITILSSPTLTTLILNGCTIQDNFSMPPSSAISSGFNLVEYHSVETRENSLFLLSFCSNLQLLYFDPESSYQVGNESKQVRARGAKVMQHLPFSRLVDAEFGGEVVDWDSFYRPAEKKGKLAFPELKRVRFSLDMYHGDLDDYRLNEVHKMFEHMPALVQLHLCGPSVALLELDECVPAFRDTLKILSIDWEFPYDPPGEESCPYLDYGVDSLSLISLPALEIVSLRIDLGRGSFDVKTPKPVLDFEQFSKLHEVFVDNGARNFPMLKVLRVRVSMFQDFEKQDKGITEWGMGAVAGGSGGGGDDETAYEGDGEVEDDTSAVQRKSGDKGKGKAKDDGKGFGIARLLPDDVRERLHDRKFLKRATRKMYEEGVRSIGKDAAFLYIGMFYIQNSPSLYLTDHPCALYTSYVTMSSSLSDAKHIDSSCIFPIELLTEIIKHLAASSKKNAQLKITMKPLCLVSKDFLELCRHYVLREIDIGFIDNGQEASIQRLKSLARLLKDQPSLAQHVRSIVGSFSNPTRSTGPFAIPNSDAALTPFFDLPNVTSIIISHNNPEGYDSDSEGHDSDSEGHDSISEGDEWAPALLLPDTSSYGRDSLLGNYLAHSSSLTTLTLHRMEQIPMVTILSSPTLTALIVNDCCIQDVRTMPPASVISSGFNLVEYHSVQTHENSNFLLSCCSNLQRVFFDSESSYQIGNEPHNSFSILNHVMESLSFSKLTEARFGGRVVDWHSFYLPAETEGEETVAFPQLKTVTFSVDPSYGFLLCDDYRGLHEIYNMLKHMPALTQLYLCGPSTAILELTECVSACQDTLKTLFIDWEFPYKPTSQDYSDIIDLEYSIEELSLIHLPALENVSLRINIGRGSFDIQTPKPKVDCEKLRKLNEVFVVNGPHNFPMLKSLRVTISMSVNFEQHDEGNLEEAAGAVEGGSDDKDDHESAYEGNGKLEDDASVETKKEDKGKGKAKDDCKDLSISQPLPDDEKQKLHKREYLKWVSRRTYEDAVRSIGEDATFMYNGETLALSINWLYSGLMSAYSLPGPVFPLEIFREIIDYVAEPLPPLLDEEQKFNKLDDMFDAHFRIPNRPVFSPDANPDSEPNSLTNTNEIGNEHSTNLPTSSEPAPQETPSTSTTLAAGANRSNTSCSCTICSNSSNTLRSVMSTLSLVSPAFLHICRSYIFSSITIKFPRSTYYPPFIPSVQRLRDLAKLLNDNPLLRRNIQSIKVIFPYREPIAEPQNINFGGGLTPLFHLPNVTFMWVQSKPEENASENCPYPSICFNHAIHNSVDYAKFSDTILYSYLHSPNTRLTTLVVAGLDCVPLEDILSSPTLLRARFLDCAFEDALMYPPGSPTPTFALIEFTAQNPENLPVYLLSLCPQLEGICIFIWDEPDIEFQTSYKVRAGTAVDTATRSSGVDAAVSEADSETDSGETGVLGPRPLLDLHILPFSRLTKAYFGAEQLRFKTFYEEAEKRGVMAFPALEELIMYVDDDVQALLSVYDDDVDGGRKIEQLHRMFYHMPELKKVSINGRTQPARHVYHFDQLCSLAPFPVLEYLRVQFRLTLPKRRMKDKERLLQEERLIETYEDHDFTLLKKFDFAVFSLADPDSRSESSDSDSGSGSTYTSDDE